MRNLHTSIYCHPVLPVTGSNSIWKCSGKAKISLNPQNTAAGMQVPQSMDVQHCQCVKSGIRGNSHSSHLFL